MQNSWQPPEEFSNDDYLKRLFEEHMLLRVGQIPNITVDTLIAYAAMQKKWIAKVNDRLQINLKVVQNEHGVPTGFIYQIEVERKLRYGLAMWFLRRGGLLGKVLYLLMGKLGAPIHLARTVTELARNYLPGEIDVQTEIYVKPFRQLAAPPDAVKIQF